MLDVVKLDKHLKALVYLDYVISTFGANKENSADVEDTKGKKAKKKITNNIDAIKEMLQKCSKILDIPGVGVYNFPLSPQYDVYNGELHCFEVFESPSEQNQYMLTINDVRFNSKNYDSIVFAGMRDLYNKTKEICAPVKELANQIQK